MSNKKALDTDALREALTDAHKRGYREGSQDALSTAASLFTQAGQEQVADVLRSMAAIDPTVPFLPTLHVPGETP